MKNFLLLSAVWVFLWASPCPAQILVEEGKVSLTVQPGETITDEITIHNTSATPFDVRLYWEDFTYEPPYTGAKSFSPPGTTERSAASFVQFTPTTAALQAFGTQKIRYSINVPPDAQGGYYGVLFVEKGGGAIEGRAGVEVIARVGSLFFIETESSSRASAWKDIRVESGSLKGQLVNQGDIILTPKGTYYILSHDGLIEARDRLEPLYLPPGAEGAFSISLPDTLSAGEYELILTYDLDGGVSRVLEAALTVSPSGSLTLRDWHD